jgi:GLPGLI family protein
MKKVIAFLGLIGVLYVQGHAQQRVVAECTVTYSISTDEKNDKDWIESLKASTKTVYIKGFNSRADLISPAFTQSVFFDKSNGTAIVLRILGNNKFITKLDTSGWHQLNSKFDEAVLIVSNETKTILGYECKKAVLQLRDGNSFTLYYTTAIIPSVREFEFQFKNIPGFVLEYETSEKNGKKVHYTATKINLNPVPASKFEIPVSGYRVLN